jgi:hypothetical protein
MNRLGVWTGSESKSRIRRSAAWRGRGTEACSGCRAGCGTDRGDTCRVERLQQRRADSRRRCRCPRRVTTRRCSRARSTSAGSTGLTQRGSTTVTPMPWARSALGDVEAVAPSRRRRRAGRRGAAARSTSTPPARSSAGMSARRRALREAHDRRGVVDLDRLAQQLAQRRRVARRGEAQARHDLEDRHVPHAVVAGAVVAGDAGAVEHERHAALVQRDVHQHLVEGPVEERRVDGDDRVQPAHRQAGGRGGRVLLGDADVEGAVGETGRERSRPTGCSIAAVIATTSSRSAPSAPSRRRTRRSRSALGLLGSPVSGSKGPGAWNWSASALGAS